MYFIYEEAPNPVQYKEEISLY